MRVEIYAQLQLLDGQLATLSETRRTVVEQLREGERLEGLARQRHQSTGELKRARGRATDLHWDLEETEVRMRELQLQNGDGPSDPLVARELAMLRERCSRLEEQVLLQMEHVEEVARASDDADEAWQKRSAAWLEQEPGLRAEWERITASIEAIQQERALLAGRLTVAALALYEELQRRHRGTAIAPIRNRQCAVCHARLSGAVFDLLAGADPLVRCPRCGRVLARPGKFDEASTDVPDGEQPNESA